MALRSEGMRALGRIASNSGKMPTVRAPALDPSTPPPPGVSDETLQTAAEAAQTLETREHLDAVQMPPAQRDETGDDSNVDAPRATPAPEPSDEGRPTPSQDEVDASPRWMRGVLDQQKIYKERNDHLEQEVQRLREENDRVTREQKYQQALAAERPPGFDEWGTDQQAAWIAQQTATVTDQRLQSFEERFAQLEQQNRDLALARTFDGFSDEQVAAIKVTMEQRGIRDPQDALAVAAFHYPDTFGTQQPPKPAPPADVRGKASGERTLPGHEKREADRDVIHDPGASTAEKMAAWARMNKRGENSKRRDLTPMQARFDPDRRKDR